MQRSPLPHPLIHGRSRSTRGVFAAAATTCTTTTFEQRLQRCRVDAMDDMRLPVRGAVGALRNSGRFACVPHQTHPHRIQFIKQFVREHEAHGSLADTQRFFQRRAQKRGLPGVGLDDLQFPSCHEFSGCVLLCVSQCARPLAYDVQRQRFVKVTVPVLAATEDVAREHASAASELRHYDGRRAAHRMPHNDEPVAQGVGKFWAYRHGHRRVRIKPLLTASSFLQAIVCGSIVVKDPARGIITEVWPILRVGVKLLEGVNLLLRADGIPSSCTPQPGSA
mmetsp:Transcript_86995/g.243910  ORF Transcript_86995/g.243910 Transcript_86995/m.243910 type:complete len:279 (+) Transcript_86995:1849-2685(+)